MNKEDWSKINKRKQTNISEIIDKLPKDNKTLIYGCNIGGDIVHVYNKGGELKKTIYSRKQDAVEYPLRTIEDLVPSGSVSPALSDFTICKLIKEYGIEIPFSVYTTARKGKYAGRIL